MNYLHGFHAGNFADVTKHLIVTLILTYLKRKDTWFQVLDTHAGRGRYDLMGDQAMRTDEAADGVVRLYHDRDLTRPAFLSEPIEALIAPFRSVLARINPDGVLRFYPGSPLLILQQLRAKDRVFASELHPEEHRVLADLLGQERRVSLAQENGYHSLRAVIPFTRKRGLVLIDPPYEQAQEFEQAVAAITHAVARFPAGIYALWYPLKSHHQAATNAKILAKAKAATGLETVLCTEFFVRPGDNMDQLNGSGLVIFNPPYTLAQDLGSVFAALQPVLQQAPLPGIYPAYQITSL